MGILWVSDHRAGPFEISALFVVRLDSQWLHLNRRNLPMTSSDLSISGRFFSESDKVSYRAFIRSTSSNCFSCSSFSRSTVSTWLLFARIMRTGIRSIIIITSSMIFKKREKKVRQSKVRSNLSSKNQTKFPKISLPSLHHGQTRMKWYFVGSNLGCSAFLDHLAESAWATFGIIRHLCF